MTDRLLGRYRLDGLLGRGSFATVHLAHDEQLDDAVAIKLLAHNHALDTAMRSRFVQEGQVLRRIHSPHILRVHDLAEAEDGRPFLVLELCDRGTLQERVRAARERGSRISPADLVAVARPLAAAIQALDDVGVVHRDLTPANILLTSTGGDGDEAGGSSGLIAGDERVVVTDLGLCKDLAVGTGLTYAGGTDGFRPPEQREAGGEIDVRSDLWAASAVLTWMATDVRPRTADEAAAALRDHGYDRTLIEAICGGLAADPGKRPASPGDWIDAILQAAGPTVGGSVGEAPAARPSPAGPRSSGRRPVVLAGAVTVVAVLALLVFTTVTSGGGADAVDPEVDLSGLLLEEVVELPAQLEIEGREGQWIAVGHRSSQPVDGIVRLSVTGPAGRRVAEGVGMSSTTGAQGGTAPAIRLPVDGTYAIGLDADPGADTQVQIRSVVDATGEDQPVTFGPAGALLALEVAEPGWVNAGVRLAEAVGGSFGDARITFFADDGRELGIDMGVRALAKGGHSSPALWIAEPGRVIVHLRLDEAHRGDGFVAAQTARSLAGDDPVPVEVGAAGVLISRDLPAGVWMAGGVRLQVDRGEGDAISRLLGPDGVSLWRGDAPAGLRNGGVTSGMVMTESAGPHVLQVTLEGASGEGQVQLHTPTPVEGGDHELAVGPGGILLEVEVMEGQALTAGFTGELDIADSGCGALRIARSADEDLVATQACGIGRQGGMDPHSAAPAPATGRYAVFFQFEGAAGGAARVQLIVT